METFASLPLEQRNLYFLSAPAYWDQVIQEKILERSDPWRLVHERTSFPLGQGLVRDFFRFHADKAEQRGLQRWREVQVSRKPAGADQGLDACQDQPTQLNYDFEKGSYRGLQSECITPYLCIDDIMHTWEFDQQLDLINNFLADYHMEKDDNFSCEMHLKFCNDARRIFALSNGQYDSVTASYDPRSVDGDGDNVLTVAQGAIGPLDFRALSSLNREFEFDCPAGQISAPMNGRRIYGLMLDLEDFERYIEQNAALREDWRLNAASVNIEGYGSVKVFRGWAFVHNPRIPRFEVKSTNGTTQTLRRVNPYVLTTTGTLVSNSNGVQGSGQGRWIKNTSFGEAEFGMAIPLLKNILELQIPPPRPSNPGGGTQFDPGNGFEGMFEWYNIRDNVNNRKGNKGYYFYEARRFTMPRRYDRYATAIMYRRFPYGQPTNAELVGTTPSVNSPQTDVSTVAIAGSDTRVLMTFGGVLNITSLPKQVSITGGITAYITGSADRPAYIVTCTSAANASTLIGNTGANVVTWS